MHHSDQGGPYASEDYQNVLGAHEITCSMSRRGTATTTPSPSHHRKYQ